MSGALVPVTGACHCGAVRFVANLPLRLEAHRCNCSICIRTGFLHVIVAAEHFCLESGEEALTDYRFHTGRARHRFCATCGVKSFYVPRSHPDGYSLNLNCLEIDDRFTVTIEPFDGKNWSRSIERLRARTGPGGHA